MELTKKEKAVIKKALKEQYYIYKRYLDSHLKDVNKEQTNLTKEYLESYELLDNFNLEKQFYYKIKMINSLNKHIKVIKKLISKLEAENGIKSSR